MCPHQPPGAKTSGRNHSLPAPEDFQLLFEASPTPYLVLLPDFTIVAVADSYLRATMTQRHDLIGKRLFEVFPDNPDDAEATGVRNLRNSLNRVVASLAPDQMPIQKYDIRRPEEEGGSFEVRYWSPVNTPVLDSAGELRYIIHRVEDVTDFVKLKTENGNNDLPPDGLALNRGLMEAELDRRSEEIKRTNAELELIGSLLKSEQLNRQKAESAEASARATADQLRAANEAQKEADQARRMGEARLQGIIDSAMDAIISVDEQQRVVLFNVAAERMFLCSASEALGTHLDRFLPLRSRTVHRHHIREFGISGATARSMYSPGIFNAIRSDGQEFPIEATISQIQAGGQKLYTVILRDITERRRAEEELRQAQKMEAIGRLAGGVAHDFNTLLNIILGYSELAIGELTVGDSRRSRLEQIQNAAKSGALLTRQLLAFSRKQPVLPQVVDLQAAVLDLKTMLRRLIPEDIEFRVLCSGEESGVRSDPGQIQQVLLNLVANARDAMPEGGNLTIEVRNVELDEAYTRQHATVTPGQYAMLAVSDTGLGMDADTVARLFEPFFTTKASGKGTGLGLATVYGIVKQNGGDIWAYSEPGRGSTFKVYLPLTAEPAARVEAVRAEPQSLAGAETILLVDDWVALRELTREILSRKGYSILLAGDGVEALERSNAHAGKIDLLLTDIVMPRMRGSELAERITRQRPDISVVYLSGYTEEAMVHHQDGVGRTAILEKPYTSDTLLRTVRSVLNVASSTA